MKSTLLMCVVILMAACGNDTQYIFKPKQHKLTLKTIYDNELVYDVVFESEEQNTDSLRKKSRALFLKGIDLYKNKKQPYAATGLFKASIVVFPDAKAYYELGNALTECSLVKEARDAYEIAEKLGFEPAASLCLKKAITHYTEYLRDANEHDYALHSAIYELRSAIKQGTDPAQIAKEKRLASITSTNAYKSMMLDMQAQLQSGDATGLFTLFKNAFKQNASNLDVLPGQVDMKGYTQSISYEFARFIPEMENTTFSREVSHDYYYVGLVKETEQYVALLYNSISFFEEDMQPTRTILAVYDQQGNLKTQKLVACQCSAEKIKRFKIKDDQLLVEDYLRVWEKPIDAVAFEENKIKSHELIARATFSINSAGEIVNEDVPAGYNDSTILAKIP